MFELLHYFLWHATLLLLVLGTEFKKFGITLLTIGPHVLYVIWVLL